MQPKQTNPGGPMTRRRFLRRSAAAASGLGIPWLVRGTALGFGRPAPSERITLGFMGLGWKGLQGCCGSLVRHFMENPVSEALVMCDVNRHCAEEAQALVTSRYGAKSCVTTQDFREVLERPDIDAVVIATPDHWHALQTIWACRYGKDVYCEKPLSLTIGEARAMVDAARQYGRVVQTGNQSRSNVNIRHAMELVRSGRIGKITEIHATCGGPSVPCYLPAEPVPDHINWDLWLGPAPWRPYHSSLAAKEFRPYRDYSGGGMTDWGAHHFDLGQWVLGMDHSGPVEIIPPDGKEHQWLTFKYACGAVMYHNSPPSAGGVQFVGTEGDVWCRGVSNRFRSNPPGLCKVVKRRGGEDMEYDAKDHSDDFLDCVKTRRRPNSDVEIGCRTATVCHLGNIAYGLNRPIHWDPSREVIIGDEEASRLVNRALREPWTL